MEEKLEVKTKFIPIEEMKQQLKKEIGRINQEDEVVVSTHWVKERGSNAFVNEVEIRITKPDPTAQKGEEES